MPQEPELLFGLLPIKGPYLDDADRGQALDPQEPVRRRRWCRRVIGTVRTHDRQPETPRDHQQVFEQVEGGGVGPVQILDHDRASTLRAERSQGSSDRRELALSFPCIGNQPRFAEFAELGQERRKGARNIPRAIGKGRLEQLPLVSLEDRSQHLSDREHRHLGRQRQATPLRDNDRVVA